MSELSDLEIVRLCARAMGLRLSDDSAGGNVWYFASQGPCISIYDPLHIGGQAMDLVMALGLSVYQYDHLKTIPVAQWCVETVDGTTKHHESVHRDLLRAIATCAARVQLAKEAKQ